MISPEVLGYIKGTLLHYNGTHCHFGELAKLLFNDSIKSTVGKESGRFVLWTKDKEGTIWTPQPHTDLLLKKVRNRLWNALDEMRYTIKSPPEGWTREKWQDTILKIMSIQEKLLDYTFMKCVLEEFIILVYSPV